MSTPQSTPALVHPDASPPPKPAYSLAVLIQSAATGGTKARAANLPLEHVEANSVREALSQLVLSARQVIADHVAREQQIPWVDPPTEASDSESRFLVPLHL